MQILQTVPSLATNDIVAKNIKIHIVGRRLRKKAKGVFMKRDELKALELTDEQVNAVMKLYGKSITELQNGLTMAQEESEKAKGELYIVENLLMYITKNNSITYIVV